MKIVSNSKSGIWLQSVVAIVVLILFCCYANSHSAGGSIKSVRDGFTDLVDESVTETFDATKAVAVESAKAAVLANTYTRPRVADLTAKFNVFVDKWKVKRLTKEEAETANKTITNSFDPLLDENGYRTNNQWLATIFIYLIIMTFAALAVHTRILRDIVGSTASLDAAKAIRQICGEPGIVRPPFSLSRTQLGIWITIISSVYVYAVLWDGIPLLAINSTALLLMGISAGTFASGAILDTVEIQQGIRRNQDRPSSGNFFYDLLSDSNGVSIHRFQNVIWTIVAIIVYIYRYNNPKGAPGLPDLDSTLLALTGISSATYLTLKTQENPKPAGDNVKVQVTLVPDAGITAAQKAGIDRTPGALSTAAVVLTGTPPLNSLTVPPDPSSPADFVLDGVPVGKYTTVTANWTSAKDASGATVDLSGTWTGLIDNNTTFPIRITVK